MKFGKSLVLLLLVFFALTVAPQASADESAQPKGQWILLPVMKLSRGIANVAFSPLELPMKWSLFEEQPWPVYFGVMEMVWDTGRPTMPRKF